MNNQKHDTETITSPAITEDMRRFIVVRHAQGISTAAAVDELMNRFETLENYIQKSGVAIKKYRHELIRRFSHYRITHPKFPKKFIPVWEEAKTSVEPDIRAEVIQLRERVAHFEAEQLKVNKLIFQALHALNMGTPSHEMIENLGHHLLTATKKNAARPK